MKVFLNYDTAELWVLVEDGVYMIDECVWWTSFIYHHDFGNGDLEFLGEL